MNVAYGGTLNQRLQEVPGYLDHRDDESHASGRAIRARPRSLLEPGGTLQKIAGKDRLQVNSLHSQGIQCWEHLAVEARAPDGVIEAFRVTECANFALERAVASGMAVRKESIFSLRCLLHLAKPVAARIASR